MEHLRSGRTVNVTAVCKNSLPPLLSGKPNDAPCFDSGKNPSQRSGIRVSAKKLFHSASSYRQLLVRCQQGSGDHSRHQEAVLSYSSEPSPSDSSVMDSVSTVLPGIRIITFSRRITFLQLTTPPVFGSLETQMFRLCFIAFFLSEGRIFLVLQLTAAGWDQLRLGNRCMQAFCGGWFRKERIQFLILNRKVGAFKLTGVQ